jgi:hypothetical protein
MLDSLNAVSLYKASWNPFSGVSDLEMRLKHSAFHSLLIRSGDPQAVVDNRAEIGREVTRYIARQEWADAGLAIHALGDSYAHTYLTRIQGVMREVAYPTGTGHYDWNLPEHGHEYDDIYFNAYTRDKAVRYATDLTGRIVDGLVGRTTPAQRAQMVQAGMSDWMTLFHMVNNEDQFNSHARTYELNMYRAAGGNSSRLPGPLPTNRMDTTSGYHPSADEQSAIRRRLGRGFR